MNDTPEDRNLIFNFRQIGILCQWNRVKIGNKEAMIKDGYNSGCIIGYGMLTMIPAIHYTKMLR